MAAFGQTCNKRQKTVKDSLRHMDANECFPGIGKIEYKGNQISYDDTLCYRYYNSQERIHGKTMEDWIKPAISLKSLRFNGVDSNGKTFFNSHFENSLENHKSFIVSSFEFCSKLGIKRWTASDVDLMFHKENVDENGMNVDDVYDLMQDAQQKYSMKPLWIMSDLYQGRRYRFPTGIGSDMAALAHAGQQIKRCLDMAQKLGSEGFAVSSYGEGCSSTLIADVQKETKHFARMLKMTNDYRERLGYRGQLLLSSRKDGNTLESHKTKYDNAEFDIKMPYFNNPLSALCFLKHHNLDRIYKLIVDPDYYYHLCNGYSGVGSLEINRDEKMSLENSTLLMKSILEQGGVPFGGINIAQMNTSYSDAKDMFIGYIKHIDNLAKGLRIASKMLSDQTFIKSLQQQYASFYNGFGARLSNGEANLEDCEEYAKKCPTPNQDTKPINRHEHWDVAFINYLNVFN